MEGMEDVSETQVTQLGPEEDSLWEFNPTTICWRIIGLKVECLIHS